RGWGGGVALRPPGPLRTGRASSPAPSSALCIGPPSRTRQLTFLIGMMWTMTVRVQHPKIAVPLRSPVDPPLGVVHLPAGLSGNRLVAFRAKPVLRQPQAQKSSPTVERVGPLLNMTFGEVAFPPGRVRIDFSLNLDMTTDGSIRRVHQCHGPPLAVDDDVGCEGPCP